MTGEARAVGERLLLDAPSLVYRVFFAWPKTIVDPQGRPINAVRGFLEMLTKLVVDRRPESVVAVFDADWRPAWRVEAYPGYKSERPEEPAELTFQFEVLAEVLDAAGVQRTEAPGLEADDALAVLVRDAAPERPDAIVTGDRDLLCLVRDPDVIVLFTLRGVTDLKRFDAAAVKDAYGVEPHEYQDFALLRGDPSDGLPGVAGIGPVRAAKLLATYGSVEGIYASLDELPVRQRAAFAAAQEYVSAVAPVIGLVRDAPLATIEPMRRAPKSWPW